MTKKPLALTAGDTFVQTGLRHTVIGEVENMGNRARVTTNVMVLYIPFNVELRIV